MECGTGVWEYNLRDILRWCELCQVSELYTQYLFLSDVKLVKPLQDKGVADPGEFMEMIYCARLRDCTLRMKVLQIMCNDCMTCNLQVLCACAQVFVTYSQIFNVGSNFCCPPHLGSYFSVSKHSVQVVLCTFKVSTVYTW